MLKEKSDFVIRVVSCALHAPQKGREILKIKVNIITQPPTIAIYSTHARTTRCNPSPELLRPSHA